MVPITSYFLLFISSVFYVFWDARILLEDYASQRDRLHFQSSSFGYTISHLDVPIIM
uniref:Transmembrane protein n=1 Tax=Medicago truncatula TaxID=3880 RepID=I3S626_MEDTR|nr:unknown [Medicago truncatula]